MSVGGKQSGVSSGRAMPSEGEESSYGGLSGTMSTAGVESSLQILVGKLRDSNKIDA